ncbi:MAG TPA: phage portal protein [Pyrinomonadaceae bacterium]|nr:phage portal protein [Pyrinomonadaceae bacterium]
MVAVKKYGGGELVPYTNRPGFEHLQGIDNISAQIDRFGSLGLDAEMKRAFDVIPAGVKGRPQYPSTRIRDLLGYHRKSELVYACIEKIAQAVQDPQLIIQKKDGKEWKEIEGHPMRRLIMRPNPLDYSSSFFAAWLTSEHVAGVFYAEKVYEGGRLKQLWPLDPSKMRPVPGKGPDGSPIEGYEWKDGADKVEFKAEEILVRRNRDLTSRFHGLAPLAVAMGSVDMDMAQTDYVRAFFNNGGVPSGVLKIKNQNLSEQEAERKRQLWMARYGRGGVGAQGPAVLSGDMEYTKVGSNIDELEADALRGHSQSNICMVFGVPPILVGAYVGLLLVNQRASAREAQQDFWMNKMSPTLASLRDFLTWNLLMEYESEELILGDRVRAFWDVSHVVALQEDEDKRHTRARENVKAGIWTLNEGRAATGQEPDAEGDFYLLPAAMNPRTGEVLLTMAQRQQTSEPPRELEPAKSRDIFTEMRAKGAKLLEAKTATNADGLKLSREPRGVEMVIDLKAIAEAPRASAGDIKTILLDLRKKLIAQAVKDLVERDPAELHKVVLTPDPKVYKSVRLRLNDAYKRGRALIVQEFVAQTGKTKLIEQTKASGIEDADDAELETFTDATVSRVINDVQSKAASLLGMLAMLRVADEDRQERIEREMSDSSTSFIEQAANAAANAAVSLGRDAEIEARSDDVIRVLYSAILDQSVCDPCEEADGAEGQNVEDLPPAPNESCQGGDRCRCFHVAVFAEEQPAGE